MTYKTHMVGGIALAGVMHLTRGQVVELHWIHYAGYYGCAVIGSLLPDIDHPKSIVSQYSLGMYKLFKKCKHRGITHTLLAVALVELFLITLFGLNAFIVGIGVGYVSHLLLDMLNVRGIPLLYPIIKTKYRIGGVRTGDHNESMLLGMLIAVTFYIVYNIII